MLCIHVERCTTTERFLLPTEACRSNEMTDAPSKVPKQENRNLTFAHMFVYSVCLFSELKTREGCSISCVGGD